MTATAPSPTTPVTPPGQPSAAGIVRTTIPEMFRLTVERHGAKDALLYKQGKDWHSLTYRQVAERVEALALGLIDLGVEHGARVALLSENRPEWAIVDLAVTSIGAVNVPLYSTLPPPQVEYIVADSEAQVVIVSNQKQLDKVLEIRGNLPNLRHVITMDAPKEPVSDVLLLSDVQARGKNRGRADLDARSARVQPDEPATIIYTSGTTGNPKGAVLSHDNFMSNALAVGTFVEIRPEDRFLSFLPLSHVFERMAGHYLPLSAGSTVAYAESVFTVQANMVEQKPTVMASVPRLYESIHSRILDGIAKQPDNKRKLAEWAVSVGKRHNSARYSGKSPGLLTSLQYALANKLVLAPLREKVTGGQLRFFISGGAPLPVETAEFLTGIGLHILEGYGLTETSPVICVNRPEKTKIGTVGPPIPGVEVKIAPDGEILSRGRHIMKGYFNKPEETAKSIDPDGWFHTGDIGLLDEDGYLKITDRKKDIIVLANGKNVAPQPIEARLKASSYIAQAVLFGDREPQVVALIVPEFEHLRRWAKENGIDKREPEELVALPQVKKLFREELERHTADCADFEKVRRFTLLTRDFSQDRDEITPTLKIKRRIVAKNYAGEIQSMYGGSKE